MKPPPLKKRPPQRIDAANLDTIEMDSDLSLEEKVSRILVFLEQSKEKDIFIKLPYCVVSFHSDVFKHLQGDALASCVRTYIERIELVAEREKGKKPTVFVPMVDDSPEIETIIEAP